jgi:dihydroorotate dehydrogenase (NAD+) catalytic subunit
MIMAGANAVQVGTATFANPRAPWRVQGELETWMARHGVTTVRELQGVAHD